MKTIHYWLEKMCVKYVWKTSKLRKGEKIPLLYWFYPLFLFNLISRVEFYLRNKLYKS